jgi:hypothetical protein
MDFRLPPKGCEDVEKADSKLVFDEFCNFERSKLRSKESVLVDWSLPLFPLICLQYF